MPPVSTQNSPRDVYPFRTSTNSSFNVYAPSEHYNKMNHHLPQVQTAQSGTIPGSIPGSVTNSPTPLSASNASSAFQFRDSAYRDPQPLREPVYRDPGVRDLPLSPGPRGSVGSNSTVVGSRGSLSSLASIGTISTRTSMGSVGSHSSCDSANVLGSDSTLGMWHNSSGDDSYFQSNLVSNGGLPTAPSSASSLSAPKMPLSAVGGNLMSPPNTHAALQVTSLPRDMSQRECHLLFALAPDFISVELNRNAVSGELSLAAKFSSLNGAHAAAQTLERRNDLFGYDVKTSVQSYAAPHPQHSQGAPRNLYSARPYLGESYWSQPPVTPLSPSTTSDLFSNSRRASLISPTDHINNSQFSHPSLVPSSPSHHASQSYENAPSYINGVDSNAPTYLASNGASPNTTGPANALNGKVSSAVASNAGSPTNTSPAASTIFAPPPPISQNSTGSSSPSSRSATVTSASVASPLTGSAPISSTSAAKTSAPIGSSIHHQTQPVSQGDFSTASHASNFRHGSTTSQSSAGSNHVDPAKIPPPNPADQNPPCNTLYVGNLPPDTSENELKGLFSQQPGYRRLCFRTKQNGPMCFVEFEDEKLAGRALSELYGVALSNSVKGGIRLSYSKNPLGVRSRPMRSK